MVSRRRLLYAVFALYALFVLGDTSEVLIDWGLYPHILHDWALRETSEVLPLWVHLANTVRSPLVQRCAEFILYVGGAIISGAALWRTHGVRRAMPPFLALAAAYVLVDFACFLALGLNSEQIIASLVHMNSRSGTIDLLTAGEVTSILVRHLPHVVFLGVAFFLRHQSLRASRGSLQDPGCREGLRPC